jgi:DNA-binding MarR family transcriptional regulator
LSFVFSVVSVLSVVKCLLRGEFLLTAARLFCIMMISRVNLQASKSFMSTPHSDHLAQDFEETLGALLHRAANGLGGELAARLQPLGLTVPHYLLLMTLVRTGPVSQIELGDQACINRSRMVGLLDDLERQGLAERRRDSADRRIYIIHLTEPGQTLLTQARAAHMATETRWLETLSATEQVQFRDLLARFVAGGEPGAPPGQPCVE